MIYVKLRNATTVHLLAGVLLSVVIVFAILVNKYEQSLLNTVKAFEDIRINAFKMKKTIDDMDSVIKRIDTLLPPDYYLRSHRELMFLAVGDINVTLRGSEVTVADFSEDAGEISLPVNIKFPVDSYALLVNRLGYLQSMNFPYFVIKNITIERSLNALMCNLEGSLRMPSEKLKGD